MKKKLLLGLTTLALVGCLGCDKKEDKLQTQTIGFTSWIETLPQDTMPEVTAPVVPKTTQAQTEEPTKAPEAPKETLAAVNKADLVGTLAEDEYYNPFFNVGFYFNEYWTTKTGTEEELENWRTGKEMIYTAFEADLPNNINCVFFNIEPNLINTELNKRVQVYSDGMTDMFGKEGFTVTKKEELELHLGDETLPMVLISATKEDTLEEHVMGIFKKQGDYFLFIQITAARGDTLTQVAQMLFSR